MKGEGRGMGWEGGRGVRRGKVKRKRKTIGTDYDAEVALNLKR